MDTAVTECNNLYFFYFRTMARSLNSRCDFKQSFFTCDQPEDVVELVLCVKTKCRKLRLKEDWEKRTEKYRPLERWTENGGSRCTLDSLTPIVSSDSGAWLPTSEFDYKPKLFDDQETATPAKKTFPHWSMLQCPCWT